MVTRGEDFDDFVRGSATRLLRTAVLLTGDRSAGEDLLQDVFERVYIRWRRIHTAPEAYARRALVNAAVNRWRSHLRRPEVGLTASHDRPTPDGADTLATRAGMMTVLQALPPRQRAVIVLRYYEDLTEAQTAEVLGCSVGTVKSQSHRALTKLRERLELSPLENH